MTKPYREQLHIEADVPNKDIINDYIKVTVEFDIISPSCGPEDSNIKKNAHYRKLDGHPRVYFCKKCKYSFYVHTSWIFK